MKKITMFEGITVGSAVAGLNIYGLQNGVDFYVLSTLLIMDLAIWVVATIDLK